MPPLMALLWTSSLEVIVRLTVALDWPNLSQSSQVSISRSDIQEALDTSMGNMNG